MGHIVSGAAAGLIATVPMTAAMSSMHRHLPARDRYPLPPRLITENLLETVEVDGVLGDEEERKLSLANHFAYGSAMGAVYAAALDALGKRPDVTTGVVFGLGVWAFSYQVLLPTAGLFPPAHRQPRRRNGLMIAAHVVWGAALGLSLRSLSRNGPRRSSRNVT